MRPSLYNIARAKITLAQATRTNGTATGTTVDMHENLDASRSALIVVFTGTMTDGSVAVTLEESSDNSSWSTVAAPDLQGAAPTIASTDDDKVFELGYVGSKRYLRVKAVTTGATSGGTFGAVIVRGFPRRQPISHT
ncbi:hypothetical protein J3A78_003871 [Streptomyces sp. PvR006]|uniref:hypothetical protein n=1 Tax=Streptomyces sp. PvR006 TaxID=2817860 RepID=UPI001AE1D0F9|nr:hypothetical protein [Streptomyces sp. PvR006]MBP2583393.1 hypothetical protein [Streptomyces sp. PvR006]